MATYNITIDSLEARPKFSATFEDVPEKALKDAIYVATRTFRSVEVINNETGEIVLTHYEGADYKDNYNPQAFNYGEAMDIMCHYCYDKE